ncbi:hypothetical protein FF011L_21720 [Roseimaritima multifibrata]|uniref:Type II secretion system protein G n=1 Tax=Roseimaritima multifibrata TaxID=1930274 RepID=A0A517MES7_9BACT|nr:prepilin-type N-terminal cleavage/methylation domain-containing protein [Roseimaritima multifibrata]QDS93402.1 hypothetical protein FF011L_21720 [Roseimaritima multifibrata]
MFIHRSRRRAFTLVELLVTMAVLTILVGMVTAALASVNSDARRARCETQLTAINAMLQARLETYLTQRIRVNPTPPYQHFLPYSARARMLLVRDQMRMELPDRKNDLMFGPVSVQSYVQTRRGAATTREDFTAPDHQQLMYRRIIARFRGNALTPTTWHLGWTEQNEASECLYLILAATTVGGKSGLEIVRKDQIGDTDGDLVPEILDPWGVPIAWIRWPAGYWLTYALRNEWNGATAADRTAAIQAKKQILGEDQFDMLYVDWRNFDRNTSATGDDDSTDDTFNMPPLVVSAGPDGEFDLMLRSPGHGDPINFATMPSPAAPTPYATPYYYPDPYPRNYHGATDPSYGVDYIGDSDVFASTKTEGWLGAYYDANGNGYDESADNIYSVRAQ